MTGSGIEADPYIIYNVNDLQAVENDLTAYYELANDIDASETSGWNAGLGFNPIGDISTPFIGHFDGKGYKVTNLFVNRPTTNYIGLFGYIQDPGDVKNVGVEDCDITGRQDVGGLVGCNCKTVTDCHATGSVTCDRGGGFVGRNLGYFGAGVITNCYSTCKVSASEYGGGFAWHNDGEISKCHALGNVSGLNVNGFIYTNGAFGIGTISDCYARGNVEATGTNCRASGFINGNYETTERCYSTGAVTATGSGAEEAGFCWLDTGTLSNCFWDRETSGQSQCGPYPPYTGVEGKTTAQMKTKSTFTDAGWDFDTIWNIFSHCNDGYPCLRDVTPYCRPNPTVNKAYALSREEL